MTTLHQRAALVLQQIDTALALAKKATPGPWTNDGDLVDTELGVISSDTQSQSESNAIFIAASRTLLPTSLRCLKTAIEGLQTILELAEASTLKAYKYSMPAELTLTTLCDQWEAEQ